MGNFSCYRFIGNFGFNITLKSKKKMIVGSIKEDLALEKRVSLTPETSKNIIGLGLQSMY